MFIPLFKYQSLDHRNGTFFFFFFPSCEPKKRSNRLQSLLVLMSLFALKKQHLPLGIPTSSHLMV